MDKETLNAELLAKLRHAGWHGREFAWTKALQGLEKQTPRKANAALALVGNAASKPDIAAWRRFWENNASLQWIWICRGNRESDVWTSMGRKPDVVLRLAEDCGVCQARNMGAVFASAPVIIFVEEDCAPDSSLAEAYLRVLRHGEVLAARGRIRSGRSGTLWRKDRLAQWDLGRMSHPWSVDTSRNLAVNARAFLDLGGFDESLPQEAAVVDFSMRLFAARPEFAAQLYCPDAVCSATAGGEDGNEAACAGLQAKWGQGACGEWASMWARAKSRFAAAGAF